MGGNSSSTAAGTARTAGGAAASVDKSKETVRDETINLLLMGIVGTGKSTTGNKLLQLRRDQFRADDANASVTSECQSEYSRYGEGVIKVVDMPGVNENTVKGRAQTQVVEAAMNALVDTPNGFDAFLVVIKHGKDPIGMTIITDQLKKMFGNDIFKRYGILVVTHGDNFKKTRKNQHETYEDYCSRQTGPLKQLWEECSQRMVLFDNITEDAVEMQNQRKKLFSIVEKMRGKPRYTPELFKAAQSTYNEMVKQAKKQLFTQSMITSIRLIIHDLGDAKVDNPQQSRGELRALKSQADVLMRFGFSMDEETMNKEWRELLFSLKKAIEMKQKLVSMAGEYQASTGDGDRTLALASVGRGNQDLDRMIKEMTKTEEDLDKKYRFCSAKDTIKIKLKESLLTILRRILSM